jgi:hypothetical protein
MEPVTELAVNRISSTPLCAPERADRRSFGDSRFPRPDVSGRASDDDGKTWAAPNCLPEHDPSPGGSGVDGRRASGKSDGLVRATDSRARSAPEAVWKPERICQRMAPAEIE